MLKPALMMCHVTGPQACAVCGTDQPTPCGLTLMDAETVRPICRACGCRETPTLQALLDLSQTVRHLVAMEDRGSAPWKGNGS